MHRPVRLDTNKNYTAFLHVIGMRSADWLSPTSIDSIRKAQNFKIQYLNQHNHSSMHAKTYDALLTEHVTVNNKVHGKNK